VILELLCQVVCYRAQKYFFRGLTMYGGHKFLDFTDFGDFGPQISRFYVIFDYS